MDSPAPTNPPEPAPPPSTDDAACVTCGYELRGLDADGRCPECGTSIERSLGGNHLVYSSFEYLDSLRRGALFIIIAAVAYLVGLICVGIVVTVIDVRTATTTGSTGPTMLRDAVTGGATLAGLALEILGFYGYWLFPAADPSILRGDRGSTARQVVRVSVIISAVCSVVMTMVGIGSLAASVTLTPLFDAAEGIVGLAGGLMIIVKFFATMVYIRWLARRFPTRVGLALDQRAVLYMWLLPLLIFPGCFVLFIPVLISYVLYCLFLNRVRDELNAVRVEAERRFGGGAPRVAG